MNDRRWRGLAGIADDLSCGETSSGSVVAAALQRIVATQTTLNAFRSVRADTALAEAKEADRRLAAGERLPLLGVPVAVKDDMNLAGDPTRRGCAGDFTPVTADSECVRRLQAAGAIVVGKTNLPEFGQWPFTEGSFGQTRNPWSLSRTPGGSSGGGAAAVAAGLVPGALGSDGAGSVRIPAAWTNLVGIKPQRGRLSTWPEPEAFNGLTCFGPLARTVEDAALLLDVASGNHPGDLHCPTAPRSAYRDVAQRRDPGKLTVGLSLRSPFTGFPITIDREIRSGVQRLAAVVESLGHRVIEFEPSYGLIGLGFLPRSLVGLADCADTAPDKELLDPRTRANAATGRKLAGWPLKVARRAERRAQARVMEAFESVDVLLTPTTAVRAPRVGDFDGLSNFVTDRRIVQAAPFAWAWNVLGWPAINVPAGFDSDGLPFGAQLLGPSHAEPTLVGLAAQLEDVEQWHLRRPLEPVEAS
ncbi:amidase [Mycolicibacterium fortuitum]|uniref:amidase n=1 Tax=Mycolicibacterium fortuitum TaxID=1766 RepID=UPI0009432525|nr:amidase [Mycolicibacterium fortuitum]